jgi:hypothetical protein
MGWYFIGRLKCFQIHDLDLGTLLARCPMIAQNAKIFGKIGAQSLANVDIHSQQLPPTNLVSSSVVNAWTRYRGSSPGRSGHGELTSNVFMPWRSKTGTELSCSLPILSVWLSEPRALASPYPVRWLSRWGKATWYGLYVIMYSSATCVSHGMRNLSLSTS